MGEGERSKEGWGRRGESKRMTVGRGMQVRGGGIDMANVGDEEDEEEGGKAGDVGEESTMYN